MPRSFSSGPLSSPSSSPTPPRQRASPPPQSNLDPAGLDSGSELSELTEDEQDSSETKSKTNVRKQPTRRTRRSIIPDQMWGWYKKKSLSDEKPKHSEPPDSSTDPDHRNGVDNQSKSVDGEDDPDDAPDSPQEPHDQPQPPPANSANKPSNDLNSDSEPDQPEPTQPKIRKSVSPEEDSDSASEASDVADEDDGEGERTESEEEDEQGNEDNFPAEIVTPEEPETPNPELADDTNNMEVDIVPVAPAANVAASSIMAGNTVIDTPSPPSSAFGSRSPSPLPSKVEKTKRAASPGKDVPEASVPPEDPDAPADEEECDPELEAEMQPAHRAEALDVLATIELKFALLREKLYVEKMEALAWEEALVAGGIHPELIHLDEELSKRRDKRLELASRRRTYEVNDATKRKRTAENAVWSWWKYERDELQVEILSETNRKRRRLERERRALERPQPIRRIPHLPPELPPPVTLRDITRNMAYAYAPGHMLGMTGAYPSLTMLSGIDVEGDLEFLNQNRRGWDIHRGPGNLQMMHHHPFESYGPVMDNVPGYGILPPGQQPSTSSAIPNYQTPPHPYNQPPPQQQYPIHSHSGRDRVGERDRGRDGDREREGDRDRQLPTDPTLPYPSSFAPPRSITPVHVNANGVLKATNGWMSGPGVIPVDERIPPAKEPRRERDREEARANREERERERERQREQREREGLDRERNHQLHLMQQQQQQRHQQQQPNGPAPSQQQHHPHHHHHHVVHHHHQMPPPSQSSYNHTQPGYLSPRRVSRDLEYSRPRSNPPLPTEVIDLSSSSGPSKRSVVNVSPVLPSGRDQREREKEREREQRERAEREREIHEQNPRMPPPNHTRPSPRNTPSIGPEPSRLPQLPLPGANVDRGRDRERDRDRDKERDRERDRTMPPFVIPPSQATQAHFSTTPDTIPKAMRDVRDIRERMEPGPGLPGPEELMMPIG